jgi:putative transcriptional regulator
MIVIRLDRVLADRKMRLNELAELVGVSAVNLSMIKTGKVRAIRFSTLEAICRALQCQPGDILEYVYSPPEAGETQEISSCEAPPPPP